MSTILSDYQVFSGKINSNNDIDAVSCTSPKADNLSAYENSQTKLTSVECDNMVENKTLEILKRNGLAPSDSTIVTMFSKKISSSTKDNMEITKYKNFDKTYTVIKTPQESVFKSIEDLLFNINDEIIIEEYDKYEKIQKQTRYFEDGSYDITLYDKEKVSKKAHVESINNDTNDNCTSQSKLSIQEYNKDGSYTQRNYSIKMNSNNISNTADEDLSIEYYDKDGNIQITKTLLNLLLVGLVAKITDS